MAEPGAVAGLEEELTCSVCLGIYSIPVSLSCGHSFCKECIEQARRHGPQSPFSCPLCLAQADPAVDLQPNVQLRIIVHKFLDAAARQEKEKREVQCEALGVTLTQQDMIPCDFCLQDPQPAVKTCLSCEASLCQAHLSKHSAKSSLKDHVLAEPCDARFLAERRCLEHGKLLECYCKTDSVCICVLCCVASSHKMHEITTLEEAFAHAKSVFPETLETVKTQEAALNKNIANLLKQETEVETKESLQISQLESLFEEMQLQLENKKGEVLRALRQNEEQQLSQIQAQLKRLKEEKDAASREVQELEALRDQKDRLLFTKAFAVIRARERKPVPNQAAVELPVPPISLDEVTTDTTLRLFQQFLSDMHSIFKAPPVHEHLTCTVQQGQGFRYSSCVVFPQPYISYNYGFSNIYTAAPRVQSDQSFSEGCHFWDVDTSKAQCWKLGIIQSSVEFYLEKYSSSLRMFLGRTMIASKDFPTALKVVRVELDCRINKLSFYNGVPAVSTRLIETPWQKLRKILEGVPAWWTNSAVPSACVCTGTPCR
ncbi:E3 ubiquitin/ISG15 ligase TRIM25-like [Podargus strigoides]